MRLLDWIKQLTGAVRSMRHFKLPNEVLLNEQEKTVLRDCINTLLQDAALANELRRSPWSVTRAEFCDTDGFLGEIGFFKSRHPTEYQQLCDAIGPRQRIGVFQFQVSRDSALGHMPSHVIGHSIRVVTDADEVTPLWRFKSLLSG